MKTKQLEFFIMCLIISAGIIFLRLSAEYPEGILWLYQSITELAESFLKAFGFSNIAQGFHKIPSAVILFAIGMAQLLIGVLLLWIFRGRMEEGAMLLLHKGSEALRYGLLFYFFTIVLMAVFLYSVVGAPAGIAVVCMAGGMSLFGGIPVAIIIGYGVVEFLGIRGGTVLYFLLGRFIMVLCESIFGFGAAFLFFIFPVFSLGACFMMILYQGVLKLHYPVSFPAKGRKEIFDRDKIRDIISRGTDLSEDEE